MGLVDYSTSIVSWKTFSESHGVFQIASTVSHGRKASRIYLSRPVLAGAVYSEGLIPRRPLYHFLWATDGQDLTVFRLRSDGEIVEDKQEKTAIKSVSLDVKTCAARRIDIKRLTSADVSSLGKLICRVLCEEFIAEFPVKHINLNFLEKRFQVESGPVLFKLRDKLIPVFMFINAMTEVQLVPFYPMLVDQAYIKRNISIEFYLYE